MKVLVPDTLDFHLDVDGDVVVYDVRQPIPDEHTDADVLVVWGNSAKGLGVIAPQLTHVKLVQSLMAGAEAVLNAGFCDEAKLANGVGLHDRTVSEHALALILALVRRLPHLHERKRAHEWDDELAFRSPLFTKPVSTLIDSNVLVWGFGSIAKTLAPLLVSLGANVRGAARSAGERDGFEVVGEEGLDEALGWADILVMILPSSPATKHALDARRIDTLQDHAFVVNVGRGDTVDEEALIAALRDGRLGGAAIDVMGTEPLPADDPLWDAPELIITPHMAGGRPVGYEELISEQIRALESGAELRNLLDR